MERIEDKSKALSYIGIEIAEALRYIPAPVQNIVEEAIAEETEVKEQKSTSQLLKEVIESNQQNDELDEASSFFTETRFETKPSLWQRIKGSKIVRKLQYVLKIKVVLDYPALPQGRGE